MLTHYQDSTGTPITVFFDGAGSRRAKPKNEAAGTVEVLFSRAGQTADDMIERAALRFQDYGEVLVVTDDYAERNMVSGFGGSVSSCANFIGMIGAALTEMQDKLKQHNRAERNRFNRGRPQ
jgi:predicted RNA-binding protein with PIN domain